MRYDHIEVWYIILADDLSVNVVSYFEFYKIVEKMLMDPKLVVLAFYRVSETDWDWSGGSDAFLSYDLARGTRQDYPAERVTPV